MQIFFNKILMWGAKAFIAKMKDNKEMAVEILNSNINFPFFSEEQEAEIFGDFFNSIVEFAELLVEKLEKQ